MAWAALWLLAFITSTNANRFCQLTQNPGCSAPFVPGHQDMGLAWLAIGRPGTTIVHLATLLQYNDPPTELNGVMAINTAMENTNVADTSDSNPVKSTYQTLTAAYPADWNACDQANNQWCQFPSYYSESSQPPQCAGETHARSAGSTNLTWNYNQPKPDGGCFMEVTAGGTSGIAIPIDEPLWQWWPKTECQCSSRGRIPTHSYRNTITLETATPDWGSSITNAESSYNPPPYTTDGGTTWVIDEIVMYDTWCQNDDPCPNPDEAATTTSNWFLQGPNPTAPVGPTEVQPVITPTP